MVIKQEALVRHYGIQSTQLIQRSSPLLAGKVLLHQQRHERGEIVSEQQHPQEVKENGFNSKDNGKLDESINSDRNNFDLRLLEVSANDLAPAPPDISGSKITSQTQASSGIGLEIQF